MEPLCRVLSGASVAVGAALVGLLVAGPFGCKQPPQEPLRAASAAVTCEPSASASSPPGKQLSPTRLLRRVTLALLGRPPRGDELDKMEAAATPEAQTTLLTGVIDEALSSREFYRTLVDYGHELLPIPSYNYNFEGYYWTGSMGFDLAICPDDSAHPGGFSMTADECKDAAAPAVTTDVWFSPGKPVTLVGRAGNNATVSEGGKDCGSTYVGGLYNVQADKGCGCGPGAQWCIVSSNLSYGTKPEQGHHRLDVESSQRRMIWDEPARLFAHVIFHDRPMTDLVLGNYTVAPPALKNLYVRWARMNPDNKALDQSPWWNPSTWSAFFDPDHEAKTTTTWHEVIQQDLHPNLLSRMPSGVAGGGLERAYTFDPRKDAKLLGLPSAGLLTTAAGMGSLARERVRAARWLEVFACQQFVPPPPEQHFAPYQRDPATEGTCQHCHVAIDPASIHFKRIGSGGAYPFIGGLGQYTFAGNPSYATPWNRWAQSYVPDTRMTPISEQEAKDHPDWRLLDFLPTDQTMLGQTSDGTVGPLGFGKMLVKSGAFDRCMARRLYEHFVGRVLDPASDSLRIDELTGKFVASGRKARPFVRDLLLSSDELRRGL
jgi:hypothetical protein